LITSKIKREFKKIMHDIKQISRHEIIDEHALKQLHDYKEDLKRQKSLFLSEVECDIRHKFSNISYDLYHEVKGGNNKKKYTIMRTRKQKNKNKTKKTKTKKTKTKKTKNKKLRERNLLSPAN
jgi:hypothetical protein